MANEKIVKYDVDGYEEVTLALMELINMYPGKQEGEIIKFSSLSEDGGIAMYPVSGAVIESETKNILGHVTEICLYPFYVIYRASGLPERRKAAVKEWMDTLGKWLEKKEIFVDGKSYKLEEYPVLTERRRFLSVDRQTPAYLDNTSEGKTEDWAIYMSARYQYEYKRN